MIHVNVTVDVDKKELERRRASNDDPSYQEEPETNGIVTSIEVEWL